MSTISTPKILQTEALLGLQRCLRAKTENHEAFHLKTSLLKRRKIRPKSYNCWIFCFKRKLFVSEASPVNQQLTSPIVTVWSRYCFLSAASYMSRGRQRCQVCCNHFLSHFHLSPASRWKSPEKKLFAKLPVKTTITVTALP